MLLLSQALAAGLSVKDGRVGFATSTAIGVVDGAGRLEWAVPVSGVEPSAVALLGAQLWVFGDGEVWTFTDGRLSGVYGAPGGPEVLSTAVGNGVAAWTGSSVLRFGALPIGARGEAVGVRGMFGAGFDAVTTTAHLPADEPCTLISATEAACGRQVLTRVRLTDGARLGTLPGTTVLAAGPAGIITGPTPALFAADGTPRASFDPADAWALGTDTVYAARADELRAFSLDGKTKWVTKLAPARPTANGAVIEGLRTSLVVDRTSGALLAGWLGPADAAGGDSKGRAFASVKGRSVISNTEVGKGRRKHPAWTMTLGDGESVLENGATIIIASATGWRLVDGRSGKGLAAGEGKVEDRRKGWLRVSAPSGKKLVRIDTGQELSFAGDAEVVGVLDSGAVVVAEAELVVTDPAGASWRAPRPAEARVDGDLILCHDAGVVYARDAAGTLRWAIPFGEALR